MSEIKENEKLVEIFEKEYFEDKESKGFIPANSTLIKDWSIKDIYNLIDREILQIRKCQGLAYELTPNYISKLEKEVYQQTSNTKEYRVKIREVAEKEISIVAENIEDAINKAEQQYNDREIVFEYDNYEDLDFKATEVLKVNRDEINLNGDIFFSYDGIRNFEELQKTAIKDLENAGEIATMVMEDNSLNIALIAEENNFYLTAYLYDEKINRIEHIDDYKIDIKSMNEEEFKDMMYNYYINTYFQYINYIEKYEEEESL